VQASLSQDSRVHPIKSAASRLRFRQALALILAVACLAGIALLPAEVSIAARVALAVFALSIIGWMLTDLNDTFVALFAATGLVISATISTERLFASLGDSIVWLMIGAFIVSHALNKSGVSARITLFAIRPATRLSHLFYLLTAALLMVPVYMAMSAAFNNPKINRALAVMLPVNILQTAVGSLVGAGAHLIINDTLGQFTGRPLSYIEWTLMGLPFAALSAFGTTWVVLHLFLDRQQRALPINAETLAALPQAGPVTVRERYVMGVTAVLVVLWMTEPLHGISNAMVAMLGALAVTAPTYGPIKFKDAAKGVEWEMILFVAATLALSEALVQSGAGAWLVDQMLVQSGISSNASNLAALAAVTLITLTSHLYITSRSARGAVIAPITVLLAFTLGLDPLTMAFVTAAGIGYCITLVVSAKPLTMFQQMNGPDAVPAFRPADLIKLSGVLAPLHAGLIVLFGLFYWPAMAQAAQLTLPAHTHALAGNDNRFAVEFSLKDAGVPASAPEAQLAPTAPLGPSRPADERALTAFAVNAQPTTAPATAMPTAIPPTNVPPTSIPATVVPATTVPSAAVPAIVQVPAQPAPAPQPEQGAPASNPAPVAAQQPLPPVVQPPASTGGSDDSQNHDALEESDEGEADDEGSDADD
jgi:di/tricarboxylate transporter